ncbi:hypothetical protein LCGC14_0755570, partial [marine sediment metagenome]
GKKMKNKKIIFGILIFLFTITGLISTSIALDNPDYTETIRPGLAFGIGGNLNVGEIVRIEYDIISGGQKDLYFYIENSTGDRVMDNGRVYGYGLYLFNVLYDVYFKIVFSNTMSLITSKTIEIKLDIIEVKTLTIGLPTSTSTFKSGYNYITWTSTGDITYVTIELYKNGVFLKTVKSWTSNDGSYSWYIYDDEYVDGSYYEIKISDYYDSSIYDYSSYFTIETEVEKTITITSPTSVSTFKSGYNYIYWASTGSIDYVTIELYKNGYFLETIANSVANDGSYAWYIYDDEYVDGSYYEIKISDYYDSSIYDYSSYFTIETEITSPIPPPIPPIPPIPSISIIFGIISMVAGVSIVVILISKHKRKTPEEVIIIQKEVPKIIYCQNCGIEIPDKTREFCSSCGTKIN